MGVDIMVRMEYRHRKHHRWVYYDKEFPTYRCYGLFEMLGGLIGNVLIPSRGLLMMPLLKPRKLIEVVDTVLVG